MGQTCWGSRPATEAAPVAHLKHSAFLPNLPTSPMARGVGRPCWLPQEQQPHRASLEENGPHLNVGVSTSTSGFTGHSRGHVVSEGPCRIPGKASPGCGRSWGSRPPEPSVLRRLWGEPHPAHSADVYMLPIEP